MSWTRKSALPLAAALVLGTAPGLRAAVATISVNVVNLSDKDWDLQREALTGDTGTIQLVDPLNSTVIPDALTSDAAFTVKAKTVKGKTATDAGITKIVTIQIQYLVPLKTLGTTPASSRLFSLKDGGGRIMQFRISYPAKLEFNTTKAWQPEKSCSTARCPSLGRRCSRSAP
jgi:hypothetical protein